MRSVVRQFWRDLRARRHVEVYVVGVLALVLAIMSLVGDLADDGLRWAVVLAALSLLVYQIVVPERSGNVDEVLHSRAVFDDLTVGSRLKGAREVWIFGPSAINLLTADAANQLRTSVLNRPDGTVRIAILDPAEDAAVAIAARQLDHSTEFPAVDLRRAIAVTLERLEMMRAWSLAGSFEYRLTPFNPGFSLLAIDPGRREGLLIVEFHGLHNESTASRMHVQLTRAGSERWYTYWCDQFRHLWDAATLPPPPPAPGAGQPTGSA